MTLGENKTKEILLEIHNIGGCDATDDYSKGWDAAVTEAIKVVENITGINIEDVLNEKE